MAVVGHLAVEAPFFFVRALVDELVRGLRRAKAVIEELLEIVDAGQFGMLVRLVIAAVIETLAVGRPIGGREFDPLQLILEIATAVHIADAPTLANPIRRSPGRRRNSDRRR